jgi:hypothetical protein
VIQEGQGGTEIVAVRTDDTRIRTIATYLDRGLVGDLINNGVKFEVKAREEGSLLMTLLVSWGPMLLLIGVWVYFMRQMQGGGKGGAFSFGKSKARMLDENNNTVTFADVAGCDEAKEEVKDKIQETQVESEPESDSESNNERQPITPIENTQQSSPKELTPPPSPISTEPPIAEQAPIEPPPTESLSTNEPPVVQGGGSKQDGGFGKPTWAPLNSGESLQSAIGLTKEQIGSTGSKLLSTIIGEKTPESIQLKLKSIDDQLRILKVQKFNTETNINNESTNFIEIRKDYLIALTNKTKFEKYSIYYDTEINKVLKPQSSQSSDMITLKTIIENKFPKTKDENGKFNFDEWRDNTFDALQNNNKDDDSKGIKPRQNEINSKIWWARIISSSPSKSNQQTNQPKNIESELNTLLDKKSKNTIELEDAIQTEQDKKPFYDEKLQEIKDLRLKLQDTNKKIKDLQETRKLVLVELTNYELPLPKGILNLFPKKQKPIQKVIQKPSFLPIGEERNKLFAQIKDIETQLKDIEEETNDEIDTQLNNNSNWKPKEDKSDKYAELVNKRLSLEKQRDNLILELEGRISKEVKEIPKVKNNISIERKRYLEKICPKIIDDLNKKIKFIKASLQQKESNSSEISELEKLIPKLEEINERNDKFTGIPTSQVKRKMDADKEREKVKKARLEVLKQTQGENTPEIISDLKKQISDLETKIKNLKSDCLKYAEIYLKEIQESAEAPPSPPTGEVEQLPLNEFNGDNPFEELNGPRAVEPPTEEAPAEEAPAEPPTEEAPVEPPTEEAPAGEAQPIVKSVFKFDDDFRYEEKNYKVREINESDMDGDTTKMKVVDNNKKIYNVVLDGKVNVETFSETDQTVKFGGNNKKQFLNHLTRRQWTRSKPSRFKTHRIY